MDFADPSPSAPTMQGRDGDPGVKILLTGARGFIGGHLAEALLSDHHRLVCPVRAAPHDASDDPRAIFVPVDFASCVRPEDWLPLLDGVDVVINTVGIFREERGQSFQRIHETVPLALFKAARQRRALVIQFSALGADRNAQSAFHTSKRTADDGLRALGIPAFIVQPSLVYGAGGASAALFNRLAAWLLLPLPGGGTQRVQPVHIADVVAGVRALLGRPTRDAVTIAFCGPDALTLRDYLATLRTGLGYCARQRIVAVPGACARLAARVADALPGSLIGPESLSMLERGNTGDATAFSVLLGGAPRPPRRFVAQRERHAYRAAATLDNLLPLLRASVAAVWLWTAIVSLGLYPIPDSLALLQRSGVPAAYATVALYGAAGLDLLFGILTVVWRGRSVRWLWLAQMALILAYTGIITWRLSEQWLHPFGPISKNLPMLAVLLLFYLHEDRRH